MTRAITSKAILLVAILSMTSIVAAAGRVPDPVVGTWKLNVAKSKVKHGPALKSATRTYEESADGIMKVTLKSVGADGKESTLARTFKEDGKNYPVNDSSGVDSISVMRVSPRAARYTEKKAGKAVLTGRREMSKDGKRLTVTEMGMDPTGALIQQTLIYDRE